MADQPIIDPQNPPAEHEQPVKFDARQQAKLNELIKDAMGRAAKELRAERDALKAELSLARTELDVHKTATDPQLNDARAELAAEQQRRQHAEEQSRSFKKNSLLTEALSKADCLSVADAASLLGPQLKFEGEELTSLDGKPLTDVVNEFLNQRPFLVRSRAKFGTGSSPASQPLMTGIKVEQIFGKGSNSQLANKLAMTNKREYNRLRAIAVQEGLLGK